MAYSRFAWLRQVTIGGITYKMPQDIFIVIATQNPIETGGTFPLPEAQMDRFMFNIMLDYPSKTEEEEIVKRTIHGDMVEPQRVLTVEEIIFYQKLLQKVPIPENVYRYAVNLSTLTRPGTPGAHAWANDYLSWGAGPRASQFLIIGARTHAVLNGKYSPDIEDIRAVAYNILRHRIIKNYKAEAEGITVEQIIDKLCRKMKEKHTARLQKGKCTISQGYVFNDLIADFERVSDHCSNIAIVIVDLISDSLDVHELTESMHEGHPHHYEDYLEEYTLKYMPKKKEETP